MNDPSCIIVSHPFWAAGSYLSLTILYTSLTRVIADVQQSSVCSSLTVHVQFTQNKRRCKVQTTSQRLQSFHQRGHCGSHPSRLSAEKACFNMHISYKQQPSDQTSAHFRFSFQIEFYHVPSGSGTPGIAFESVGLVLTDLWWHVVPSAATESATVQLFKKQNSSSLGSISTQRTECQPLWWPPGLSTRELPTPRLRLMRLQRSFMILCTHPTATKVGLC